jgi:hypothetical protein
MRAHDHVAILPLLVVISLTFATGVQANAAASDSVPSDSVVSPKRPDSNIAELKLGQSYLTAAPIAVASTRSVPAEAHAPGAIMIPVREELAVVEVVRESGSTWYFMDAGRFGHGWLHSTQLAAGTLEPSEWTPFDTCAAEKVRIRSNLDGIARERAALGKSASVEQLVDLDSRIRTVMGDDCAAGYLEETTSTVLGIAKGHWSDGLVYSGKILGEAHEVDPRSPLRPRTLFGTVERYGKWHADGVPDFAAAKTYLGEFPNGPFAADAAWILARAYKMAYLLNQQGLDCVSDQLTDVTSKPPDERRPYAKQMAEAYFQETFRLRKPDRAQLASYESFHGDGKLYDYCSD